MDKRSFLSGMLGGLLILSLAIIVLMNVKSFNYAVKIYNPKNIDSIENYSLKRILIKEMEEEGILLTPQEYTNNLISYYNTFITVLASMLVIFSIIGYLHLRSVSDSKLNSSLSEYLKSEESISTVNESIFGKAEDTFAKHSNLEQISAELISLTERVTHLEEIDNGEQEIEP